MDLKSKIILIYGPTSSGKSQFAVKLAKKINGEVINADSMQIYKELNILTARPFKSDYKKIKHHLYGFQSVKKNFSTGDWLKLANCNSGKFSLANLIDRRALVWSQIFIINLFTIDFHSTLLNHSKRLRCRVHKFGVFE